MKDETVQGMIDKIGEDVEQLNDLLIQFKESVDQTNEEEKKEWEDFKNNIIPVLEDIIKNCDYIAGSESVDL